MPDVDVAILGAGCAGLSLAMRLAGGGLSVRLIDPRTGYENDRTWSFWRTAPHPWEAFVRQSWQRWSVAGPTATVERQSHRIRYQTLEARSVYDAALARIDADPLLQLDLGVSAQDVQQRGAESFVDTSDGGFSAASVIDTRPPKHIPTMSQVFIGQEIATSKSVFDTDVVHLMHFRSGYSDGVDFLYILPFAPNRALVEVTSFARTAPSRKVMSDWLDTEIASLDAGGHDVLRAEAGCLPMEVGYRAKPTAGIVHMGLAGGAARPATGYAFQRIQAQADQIATQLISGQTPTPPRDGMILQTMDAIFLRVLASRPHQGPAYFQALFDRVEAEKLERFLSGSTRTDDRLAVITALPPVPFLAAAAGLA